MKFPKTTKTGGVIHNIIMNPANDREHAERNRYGGLNHQTRVISIDSTLPDAQKRETLFHEEFHSIFRHTNLDEEFGDRLEDITTRVTIAFMMVAHDNPELIRLLLDDSSSQQGETNDT